MDQLALNGGGVAPVLRSAISIAVFSLIVVALGRRALRIGKLSLPLATPVEKALIAGALGCGLLQYLPYGLALFGVMKPGVVRLAALALCLLLSVDALAVVRRLFEFVRGLSPRSVPRVALVWAGLLAIALVISLIRSSVVAEVADDDGYHLAAPKRWLEAGALIYLPSFTNTNASMGFEMLYAIGMSVADAVSAKAFNYSAGLFTLLGVWRCARRMGGPEAAALTLAVLLIAQPMLNLQYVFSLAYVDLATCWMTMATLLCWLLWQEQRDPRLLLFMGLLAGFGASFKTTAIVLVGAWALVLLIEQLRRRESLRSTLLTCAGFCALSLLPMLPWFFRNYSLTGNPLYPMAHRLIPTRDWTDAHAVEFSRYVKYYTWAVLSGARLPESSRKLILFATAGAFAGFGALAQWRIRRVDWRSALTFVAAALLASVLLTGLVFRYWLPALFVLVMVACAMLYQARLPRRLGFVPAALVMAIALSSHLRVTPSGHELPRDFRLALGLTHMDDEYRGSEFWSVWKYLNTQTPRDAHVLMAAFFTSFAASSYGGFWVDRMCYATDSHLQTYIRLDSWDSYVKSIRDASIDYVVLSDKQFAATRHGFVFPEGLNEYPFARKLVEQYGTKRFQVGFLAVYEVHL